MHVRHGQISDSTEDAMHRLVESAHADGFDDGFRAGVARAVAVIQREAGMAKGTSSDALFAAALTALHDGDVESAKRADQRRAAA